MTMPSQSTAQHRCESPKSVRCAVITVSDTRTLETDRGGQLISELLSAAGHTVTDRQIVRDVQIAVTHRRPVHQHRVIEEHGVITVAGGKYTTFRVMARDVLVQVMAKLGRPRQPIVDSDEPLPVSKTSLDNLEATVTNLVENEFAQRLEDVLRRRTTFWMEADRGRMLAGEVAGIMSKRLGWPPARMNEEMQAWVEDLKKDYEGKVSYAAGYEPPELPETPTETE